MDLLDMYSIQTLTHAVNHIIPEAFFLSDTIQGKNVLAPTESTMFDVKASRRDLAPLRHNGAPAVKVDYADTYNTYTVTPPQIYLEDEIEASAVASRRMAGMSPLIIGSGNEGGVGAALNDYIAGKQKNMLNAIYRRIEWMYGQILTTGKLVYPKTDMNKKAISIDFGLDSTNVFDASALWDASTNIPDPIMQLKQWRRTFVRKTGMLPDLMVVGEAAADAFNANPNIVKWLQSPGVSMLQISNSQSETLATRIATIPDVGDLIEYSATYPADGTGTLTPYIPDDVLILTNKSVWELHYGAISDFDLGDNPIAMTARYSKLKTSPDGKTKRVFVESHPLPVLTHSAGIMVITVCGS